MKVKVNRTEIEIFEGAKVRHAVLQYLVRRHISASKLTSIQVLDAYDHITDLDAPLTENQAIKVRQL